MDRRIDGRTDIQTPGWMLYPLNLVRRDKKLNSMLSCRGMSQDAQAKSRHSATFLSSDQWFSMKLPPGTLTMPKTFSILKLFYIQCRAARFLQATIRQQAIPARSLLSWLEFLKNRSKVTCSDTVSHYPCSCRYTRCYTQPQLYTLEALVNATCYYSAELMYTDSHSSQ